MQANRFVSTTIEGHRQAGLPLRRLILVFLLALTESAAAQQAPPVAVVETRFGPVIEELPLTGTITSPQTAQLSPAVGGLVEGVLVEAGDPVEADAPLLRLNVELEQIALRRARAATREAREALADARRRLEEARSLAKNNNIAAAQVRALEAETRIDAAALERLQAEEQHQAAVVARHELKAPFAGVISRKLTEAGEWVETGTPVLELVAVEQLRLDIQVPQAYFPRLGSETEVAMLLDAYPDKRLAGRIGAKVPVSDPTARTFMLRIFLDNPDTVLLPGMAARALLRLDTGEQAVLAPRDALIRYPDGRVSVWVVDGDGDTATVAERFVTTGLTFDGKVEIRDGLTAGARVVTRGNEALQEGQSVQVRRDPDAARRSLAQPTRDTMEGKF